MIKRYLKALWILLTLTLPTSTLAVKTGLEIPGGGDDFKSYIDYMGAIFSFAMKAGAVLTTLMIIYAGYKYLTSQGNPTALGEAKDIIIGSLSGFAMLLLIYLILTVLQLPPAVNPPAGTT